MTWRELNIDLRRSARKKTLHIIVERDGTLSVQAPQDTPEEKIRALLDAREYVIRKKLALWKESNKERIERPYVAGQSFQYLGRNYNLSIVEEQNEPLLFKDGKFLLLASVKNPRETFMRFFKRQARVKIAERIAFYKPHLPVQPQKVQIRDMLLRWGSCTPSGNIYYNWRCVMAPLFVLDYLILHELIHLRHPDHSRDFWQALSTFLPDYESAQNYLRRNGIRLTL